MLRIVLSYIILMYIILLLVWLVLLPIWTLGDGHTDQPRTNYLQKAQS